MKTFPDYCYECKHRDGKVCLCGHKNPTETLEAANHQAAHKGEWPCSYAPHREKFVRQYERRHV